MTRDRRIIVITAGLLAAISASLPRISGALKIPEVILLAAVIAAEVILVVRMYFMFRR